MLKRIWCKIVHDPMAMRKEINLLNPREVRFVCPRCGSVHKRMAREDIISLGRTLECIMEAAELGDIDACHEAARQALREANCDQPIRTR